MTDVHPSICFVAPSGYLVLAGHAGFAGGAEMQQALIASGLASRGYRVSMISMDFGQVEGTMVRGVRVLKMHAPGAGVPVLRYAHPRLTSLWSAMRRADADLYYQRCSGAQTGFVAAFARRNRRTSVFAGAHDSDFDPALPMIRYARDRATYRWGLRRVDRIVVQSERQRALCRSTFGRDAVRIDSCYAHRGKAATPGGVILWVANAKRHKRPHLLLDLAQRLPQYRFRLVGGPIEGAAESAYFEGLCRRAASLPNVEMTGFVPIDEVEALFDDAAVFVNTSVGEGFPNTFLQAWSRGIPTVSFFDPEVDCDGHPVGVVVEDLETMRLRVDELMREPLCWQAASQRARRVFAERYSVDRTLDAYESLIDEVLADRRHEPLPAPHTA